MLQSRFSCIVSLFTLSVCLVSSCSQVERKNPGRSVSATVLSSIGGRNCFQLVERFNSQSFHFNYLWNIDSKKNAIRNFIVNGIFVDDKSLGLKLVKKLNGISHEAQSSSDQEIFNQIKEFLMREGPSYMNLLNSDDSLRVTRRVKQFSNFIDNPPSTYIDIGAGDGNIAAALAKLWSLSKSKVYGVDIARHKSVNQNITWLKYEDYFKIPLPDKSVELASLTMVLHHMDDPKRSIEEIHRILKKNGRLIIRETDAVDKNTFILNEFLDRMFYAVFSFSTGVPLPNKYRSLSGWKNFIESNGFKMIRYERVEDGSPFAPFHMILKKERP